MTMITDAVTDFEGKPEGKPADGTEEADRLAGDLAAPGIEDEIGTRSLAEIAKEACEAIGIEPAPELVVDADGDDEAAADRRTRATDAAVPAVFPTSPGLSAPTGRRGEDAERGDDGIGPPGSDAGMAASPIPPPEPDHDPPSG